MLENRVPDELVLTPSPEEESEADAELSKTQDELVLTPSPEEEEPEDEELILEVESTSEEEPDVELVLESETPPEPSEITFDGEDEAEEKIRKAMEEYDAAMDQAAWLKHY